MNYTTIMPKYVKQLLQLLKADPRTSSDLSKATGIHPVMIRRFRTGAGVPDHETAAKLADALGVQIVLN